MIKRNFGWTALIVIAGLMGLMSCEQEDRFVGSNVVGDGAAEFNRINVDVTATTLQPDSIRSDRSVLQNATLGVFDEPLFGKTKSYYYTQVRLGTTDPTFGDNSVVDSVVLTIPVFAQTSDTLSVEHYLDTTSYEISNSDEEGCTISDTLRYYNTNFKFKIDSLYGDRNAPMLLQVHQVVDDLKTIDSVKYSNESPQVGQLLGSKQITDEAWTYTYSLNKTADIENDSTIVSQSSSAVIRVKLDGMRDFVQQNIVNQEGSSNLGDQISFINNVIKGIRIGVADENGFILTFDPTLLRMVAYISEDNENFVDANGDGIHDDEEECPVSIIEPRVTKSLSFALGSRLSVLQGNALSTLQVYNVSQNEIINENGNIAYDQENLATNFVEGMGGAKIKISINPEQIEAIRDSVAQNNWIITEAHFKIYPDTDIQNGLSIPEYLYAYNYTEKTILPDYGDPEESDIQAFPYLQINRPYSESDYYLLRVTEFIKNIVEKNDPVDDLAIEMGSYLGFSGSNYFYAPQNAFYSNRVFNPYRVAVVGTNPASDQLDKKLQLEIFYNKRED